MDIFKRFIEEKLPDKKFFYSFAKDRRNCEYGEKLDGHISNEYYLTCKKFNMKNIGDYHDHYLKKDLVKKNCLIKFCFTAL